MIKLYGNCSVKQHNENGFSLVEIIVVIAIISIAMTLGGYGISQIYDSHVESSAEDIFTELRSIQYHSMTDVDTTYALVFTYDSGSSRYGYKVYQKEKAAAETDYKNVVFKKHISVDIMINGAWVDINTLDPGNNEEDFMIYYSALDGSCRLTDFSGSSIGTFVASATNQRATFRIRSSRSSQVRELTVVQLTGRVSIKQL